MFAQPIRYLASNNKWTDSFSLLDPSTGQPRDLTALSATIFYSPAERSTSCSSDWYNGTQTTASTTTGEIINGGTSGTLVVSIALTPGIYKVRGEISVPGITTPFLSGQLTLSRDGWGQMLINPLDDQALIWNDGGVLAVGPDLATALTSLPTQTGVVWINGGVVSIS